MIAGLILGKFHSSLGIIGTSIQILTHINPNMLLFIFVPVLIFESGYNCSWYVFKRVIVNILILASPGVFLGSLAIGFIFKVLLDYKDNEMNWYGAFMIGAIISATDPVALLAILKDLGASIKYFLKNFLLVYIYIYKNHYISNTNYNI